MNGNTLGDGVNAYSWDADNMLTSAGNGGSAAETYNYDADGERITRLHNGVTTYYIGGVLEVDVQGGVTVGWRVLYSFSGQLAEVRSSDGSNTFIFGDGLGSTEVASDPAGNAVSRQKFDPWGAVRPGSVITQTTVNYTGQRKDDTGLLYYHARYYDPTLARFMSADSIVPGTGPRSLTVDFHEPGFAAGISAENAFTQQHGFWFQLSNEDRQHVPPPWGPEAAQALNRYSYVTNNPLRYTDPSGHSGCGSTPGCGGIVQNNSTHGVWVFGIIQAPGGQLPPGVQADPGFNGGHPQQVNADGRPDPNGGYLQGWFYLPPGQSSDTYLHMTDADAVRAYDVDLCDLHGHCSHPDAQGTEEYKFGNSTKILVGDFAGQQTLVHGPNADNDVGRGFWLFQEAWEFAWHQAGWRQCSGGCTTSPYK